MKTYTFNLDLKLELEAYAENEAEARSQLNDLVVEYFNNTETVITEEEAELVEVSEE